MLVLQNLSIDIFRSILKAAKLYKGSNALSQVNAIVHKKFPTKKKLKHLLSINT